MNFLYFTGIGEKRSPDEYECVGNAHITALPRAPRFAHANAHARQRSLSRVISLEPAPLLARELTPLVV
jgi:hypothetical protein